MRLIFGVFGSALWMTFPSAQRNQFQGSVPAGTASDTALALTLRDAIDRGLKANLGLLVSDSNPDIAPSQRAQAMSAPLPHITDILWLK